MGNASSGSSATRSRTPHDTSRHLSQSIPEMFRTQAGNMVASSHGSSQASSTAGTAAAHQTPSHQLLSSPVGPAPLPQLPQLHLNDLRAIAADIKDMLSAAISDLEITDAHHETTLRHMHHAVDTHTLQLRDMNRRMEDLDNRGRRHNLRVRGLPETVEPDQLLQTVVSLFNNLLDRPHATPIELESIEPLGLRAETQTHSGMWSAV